MTRKVFTIHGNPVSTHHKATTDRSVPFGRSEGPDGYVTNSGSVFVDVWGEEGGVYVANNTDTGSVLYETLNGTDGPGLHVGEVMGRSWRSSDDTLAVSWEVGEKILYVQGSVFDVSGVVAGDIFACSLRSDNVAVIVDRASDTAFNVYSVRLADGIGYLDYVYPMTISDPVLFIGFASAKAFYCVTSLDTASNVYYYTYNPPVWTPTLLHTVSTLHATSTMSYQKELDNGFGSSPNEGNVMGSYSRVAIRGENLQTDTVHLQGERIIACSTHGTTLGLLVQSYVGTQTRTVSHPRYSWSEYVTVFGRPFYSYPMMILIKWVYTWAIGYTGTDSGKLLDGETVESQSSFYALKIKPTPTGSEVTRVDSALPNGTYSRADSEYTRTAHGSMDLTGYWSLVVPPYEDIWAMRQTYREAGGSHTREFNSAIKLYAANPAKDIYLYQLFNGTSRVKWNLAQEDVSSNNSLGLSPAPEDLADLGVNSTGTIATVLRNNGTDIVLHSRDNVAEAGDISLRYDFNYEPTMPYYTQPQGPYRYASYDHSGTWSNSEDRYINKSINIAFKGRYIDTDAFKSLVTFDYTANAENTIPATLNFRTFEDINYLKYKGTWTESYRPKTWSLIRGWGEFIRRAGFKTINAKGGAFATKKGVMTTDAKQLPISLRPISS